MIYLDVTSSCKSPMNTGVQRMVRGIFDGLHKRVEVTPLLWSPKLTSYCRLSDAERQFLSKPFHKHPASTEKPERLSAPFPWSRTARHLRNKKNRFPPDATATARDVFLTPEIFQDNRIQKFEGGQPWFPGRTVAVFHDAIALRLPEHTASERKKCFADYVKTLSGFDHVVCVSREAEADLIHFWDTLHVANTRTSVLGWPTDFGRPRPASQPHFAPKRVLCVATLERRKNHLRLLEAAESLWKDGLAFELVLIGRTTADWGATVLNTIERLEKQDRPVRWLRHVSDDTLHRAYRECSCTVYPSLREGFGLPIHESLWHGRPCVCGSDGALGEAASGGGCRLVDPSNTNSLADGLRELLTDESACARLANEAAARVFRSWDDYIDDLLRILHAA